MPIRKSNDTLFYLIGIIPVVWLALLLAQSLGGGLPELLRNLTRRVGAADEYHMDRQKPAHNSHLPCRLRHDSFALPDESGQDPRRRGTRLCGVGHTRIRQCAVRAEGQHPADPARPARSGYAQAPAAPSTCWSRRQRRSQTRSFVLPNILTANTNYVITDPKSEVLLATGGYLKEQGYDVRVLNLVNLEQSDGYNPFRYLRDEKDVLKLVNNLIQSTTPKGSHESDPFWTKAETALLQAIILMLFQEAPEYEQNFSMVMRVLEYAEVREEDEGHVSPLDLLFESIERRKPDSVAVRQYKVFKLAAG